MLYGKGAGKFPTASAIVSDIISCIKNLGLSQKAYWEDDHSENRLNHCSGLNKSKCYFKVMENGIEKAFIAESISGKEMENSGIKLISSIMILE
jgi:Homoserine dehydrogenase